MIHKNIMDEVLSGDLFNATIVDGSKRFRAISGIPVQEFAYNVCYTVCADCPERPLDLERKGDCHPGHTWALFWDKLKSMGTHFTFTAPQQKAYNVSGSYLVIYDATKVTTLLVSTLPSDYKTQLEELGYVYDSSLYVPFLNREAYYDRDLDNNCNSCGLATPNF